MLIVRYQDQQVEIELLENSFVKKWSEHFQYMLGSYPYRVYFSQYPYRWEYNKDRVDEYALKLSHAVKSLIELGTGFPEDFDVTEADNIEKLNLSLQQKLNRLHRYFTTCNRDTLPYATEWGENIPVTGGKDKATLEKIREYSHQVNVQVHNLEHFISTPNKELFLENPRRVSLSIDFSMYKNNQENSESSQLVQGVWRYMTADDFEHLSNDPTIDVWLPDNILGKPFNVAFYDHDDPTQWDITYNLGYTGSLSIGIVGNKASEMQTPEIVNWLRSHGIDSNEKTCGMPIGRIVQGKDIALAWYKIQHEINFSEFEVLLR